MRSRHFLLAFLLLGCLSPRARGESRFVDLIELENQIITPVTQQYIIDAIGRAETKGAECLIIKLDTPGGLLESTRVIVKRILNSKVPVAVYVAPSGARAGSAGVFITMAAHVAAMAPSTNIGAAHPVTLGDGEAIRKIIEKSEDGDTTPGEKKNGETTLDPMSDKVTNDTVAWITAIADMRGRNKEWARKAVTESVSVTDTEALKENIIDLIATNVPDLLNKMNGRTVRLNDKPYALQTAAARVVEIPMTGRQRLLAAIVHPNVAYILMMLGMLGLIFEFTHPGFGFPGIAGAVCLLLGLYASQVLSVNFAGIGLMVLGLGLMVAEAMVVSHGALAIGGIVCLTLGSLVLFGSPDAPLRVSWSVILPTVATLTALILFLVHRALTSFRQPVATGAEALVGTCGPALTDLAPEGTVFVHGEYWRAVSAVPVKKGDIVCVTSVNGLTLTVTPQTVEK